jgi:hypothetical protein
MTWATYRDRPEGSQGCASYYSQHVDDAAVTFDVFRSRVKRGMPMHEALTTPKTKEWNGIQSAVLAAIAAHPGILRRELGAMFGRSGGVSTAVDRLIVAGVIRAVEETQVNAWYKRITVRRFYPVEAPQPLRVDKISAIELAQERTWTPPPYVNPIRARALGLPVAETERTREVREAFAYRPGRAA